METDVLVLGGGLAGTRAALAARRSGARVVWAYLARGASPYIIGANVPLGTAECPDTADEYASDMLEGGYGLGEPALVNTLARQSVPAFEDLLQDGVPFARTDDALSLRHLSGNRHPRSVYVPDGTGKALLRELDRAIEETGLIRMAGHRAVSLLAGPEGVSGAVLSRRHSGTLQTVHARATVIALGGIGRVFGDSTYPADVCGDGAALALEAGATLIDMEFVQFEPVVTHFPEGARGMEMPTAMLGDGATLLNARGERFMLRYNPGLGERGIEKARMALCIQREIDEGRGFDGGTVRFDTTTLPRERLESYVSHCRRLRLNGCDPALEGPLVRPAAHSIMGGILADPDGWTGVRGLFACGEAVGGIHGASRIAGNGGGETMTMGWVVGRMAAQAALDKVDNRASGLRDASTANMLPKTREDATNDLTPLLARIRTEIRAAMDRHAGLYRTGADLEAGLRVVEPLFRELERIDAHDLDSALAVRSCAHMAMAAVIVLRSALMRTESRGAHQRRDYPSRDDREWLNHVSCRLDADGSLAFKILPLQF